MYYRILILALVAASFVSSNNLTVPSKKAQLHSTISVQKRSEVNYTSQQETSASGSTEDREIEGSGSGDREEESWNPIAPNGTFSNFLHPDCVPIALEPHEFTHLDENTVVFRGEEIQVLFWTITGNPVVCSDFSQNGTTAFNVTTNITTVQLVFPEGFAIASYVGCSLSVLGSFFLLVTHSMFKELRTLPSLLVMSLAVAFLVGDLLILLGSSLTSIILTSSRAPCVVVAILLHYWFLARFCWSNIIAFEMVRSFTSATKLLPVISTSAKKTIFVVYSAIGWGVPLAITLISVVVNFTTEDLVRYGAETCWINDVNSALVAFVAPLVLSLLINIISFIVILFYLCKGQIQNRNVSKSQLNVRLYVAVFSVMGLTWIFGFVAILARNSWAWYPFIVLNSTQALVVALSFTCTKKIARYYLELLCAQELTTSSIPGKTVTSANKVAPSSP